MELPTGTITFLLTDVEGSTGLWEKHPSLMNGVLARHEQLGAEAVDRHQGCLIRTRGEGDSMFAVFARASDAVAAACDFQRALGAEPWPAPIALRVRMALHTGEASLRDNDYYGSSVNRCARLRAIAHGGQVLLSGATEALVRGEMPPGASVRALGEHRLRDLEYPEQVYQLRHPELQDGFGRLLSLDALPNNLPQQLTSFIGREAEMTEVESLLRRTRLLTITGPGGSGKTRLSLQVAADVLDGYPDGVWWVEVGGVTDPDFVPRAVATALDLREEPDVPLADTVAKWLRPRQALLVLDNCEHLLDACSSLAQDLLMACPRLKILASSREVLGVSGEILYRVPLLSLPDPDHLPPPGSLGEYEAVQLFVERAAAQRPGFAVTSQNAFHVARVCHRLDGIPLALELAAARMRAMPVQQIADRLETHIEDILRGGRKSLPRQQTLTALMDWSYDLLSAPERALLHRLSIFRGGWTLDAAENICTDEEPAGEGVPAAPPEVKIGRRKVLDLLTSLVDKSLVQYEESSDGLGQYRILETIRQYAYERLASSGDADRRHRRHATWYLNALQRHAERRQEERVGVECAAAGQCWLDAIRADYMNVQSAIQWAMDRGDVRTVIGFIDNLFPFWVAAGYVTEGRNLYARLLQLFRGERAIQEGDASSPGAGAAADVILCAGQLAKFQGDLESSRSLFREVLALSRAGDDSVHIHEALVNLGFVEIGNKNFDAARGHFETSREFDQGEYPDVRCLIGLGLVARFEGRYGEARGLFAQALEILPLWPTPDPYTISHTLLNLGHVSRLGGDLDSAAANYRDALKAFVQLVDRVGIAYCLDAFAGLAVAEAQRLESGDAAASPMAHLPERAEDLARRAIRLFSASDASRRTGEMELSPVDREERDLLLRTARNMVGSAAGQAAWGEGKELSLQEAISLALSGTPPLK